MENPHRHFQQNRYDLLQQWQTVSFFCRLLDFCDMVFGMVDITTHFFLTVKMHLIRPTPQGIT
jgi:hypothetical protein